MNEQMRQERFALKPVCEVTDYASREYALQTLMNAYFALSLLYLRCFMLQALARFHGTNIFLSMPGSFFIMLSLFCACAAVCPESFYEYFFQRKCHIFFWNLSEGTSVATSPGAQDPDYKCTGVILLLYFWLCRGPGANTASSTVRLS